MFGNRLKLTTYDLGSVSNNFMRNTSDDIPAHELPAAYSLGALEPIAYFYGAMPTGVTVSHKGRIFVNFPKWGDDVKYTVADFLKMGTRLRIQMRH